jgi:hypothetical protein
MKYMKQIMSQETILITANMSPHDVYNDIKDLSNIWVLNDPEYKPLSSGEIREIVAQLMRKNFFVVQGALDG